MAALKSVAIAAAAILQVAAWLCTAAPTNAETVLTVHHFLPTSSTTHARFIEPWADRVNRESGGRLNFRIFPSMQLGGKPPQLYDQARDGVADIVWTLPGYTPGRFPSMEVFELPFVAAGAEATSQAAWAYYEKHARADFADVQPLLLHVHAPGSFHLRSRPIESLDDFAGLKIRAPSRVINSALKALGATPVGMPVPQVPQALSKGVIDGAVIPFEVAQALKVPDLVKFHTEVGDRRGFYTAVFLFAMNKARYEGLPDDLKAVIDANSGLTLAKEIGRLWDEAEVRGRTYADSRGNRINRLGDAATADWRDATRPVIDGWIRDITQGGRDGKAMLEDARALIAKYGG